MVPTKVNGSKPLWFLLDTGYGVTTIHPDLIEPLGLKRAGQLTIVGIAGEEKAVTYEGAVFDFGGTNYSPRRVASLPSDAENFHHRRDGVLGAGFFRRFVVEVDFAKNILRLHEPQSFDYSGKGEILPLQFEQDVPIVEATITTPRKKLVRGRFDVDTGCDDHLCLSREFVETNQLALKADAPPSGKKVGVGGGARIHLGTVSQLQLGRFTLKKVSANFFADGSPAGKGIDGHIGMATLQHYKVIFDYSRRRMILEEQP